MLKASFIILYLKILGEASKLNAKTIKFLVREILFILILLF